MQISLPAKTPGWTRRLAPVLLAALVPLAAYAADGATATGILPNPACGTYDVTGTLGQSTSGTFILTMNKHSNPFELVVLGGSIKDKLAKSGSRVKAVIYMPKPITSGEETFVFLQKFVPLAENTAGSDGIRLVKKEKCAMMERYLADRQ